MRAGMSTNAAIVLGSLIVAVGLFLGLRGRSPEVAPVFAEPVERVGPAVAAVVAVEVVTGQALEAVKYHHRALRERCYLPVMQGEAAQRPVRMVLHVTFDARGEQLLRGVVERREAASAEVTRCVLEQLPSLRVPAPGGVVAVELPLDFL